LGFKKPWGEEKKGPMVTMKETKTTFTRFCTAKANAKGRNLRGTADLRATKTFKNWGGTGGNGRSIKVLHLGKYAFVTDSPKSIKQANVWGIEQTLIGLG